MSVDWGTGSKPKHELEPSGLRGCWNHREVQPHRQQQAVSSSGLHKAGNSGTRELDKNYTNKLQTLDETAGELALSLITFSQHPHQWLTTACNPVPGSLKTLSDFCRYQGCA